MTLTGAGRARYASDRLPEVAGEGDAMATGDTSAAFGDFDPGKYEAEGRWGGTEAYAESARRTARFVKADRQRIKAEGDDITAAFVEALDRGLAPEDPAVRAVVERHWTYVERWFYTPSPEMYVGRGDLYVDDPRFTKTIDKAREGSAAYQRAAMRANAKRMRKRHARG